MPPIVISLLNFLIGFILIAIFLGLIILLSKKCRFITVILFYFFLGSLCYYASSLQVGTRFLNFYEGMGSVIDATLSVISIPFISIYTSFSSLVVEICKTFVKDVAGIEKFLISEINIIYFLSVHAGLFLISALIFRKRKKIKFDNSRYRD